MIFDFIPAVGRRLRSTLRAVARFCCISGVPLTGLLALVLAVRDVFGNLAEGASLTLHAGALTLFGGLLLRNLDQAEFGPFTLRISLTWGVASTLAFVGAIFIDQNTDRWILALGMVTFGILAGFATVVPLRGLPLCLLRQPRLTAVALLGSLCPLAFDTLHDSLWRYSSLTTAFLVQSVLNTIGIGTEYLNRVRLDDGFLPFMPVRPRVISLQTPYLAVRIHTLCSGVEGVFLCYFLICLVFVMDWKVLSRFRHLSELLVIVFPYMMLVNVLRIAGIIIYAGVVSRGNPLTGAGPAAVEAFHSNAGLYFYTVSVGLLLVLCYRSVSRKPL